MRRVKRVEAKEEIKAYAKERGVTLKRLARSFGYRKNPRKFSELLKEPIKLSTVEMYKKEIDSLETFEHRAKRKEKEKEKLEKTKEKELNE